MRTLEAERQLHFLILIRRDLQYYLFMLIGQYTSMRDYPKICVGKSFPLPRLCLNCLYLLSFMFHQDTVPPIRQMKRFFTCLACSHPSRSFFLVAKQKIVSVTYHLPTYLPTVPTYLPFDPAKHKLGENAGKRANTENRRPEIGVDHFWRIMYGKSFHTC